MRILFAAIMLSTALTLGAQAQPMQNNKTNITEQADRNYEAMLRADPAFRAKRIDMECGPLEDADLKRQCLESFPPLDSKKQAQTPAKRVTR